MTRMRYDLDRLWPDTTVPSHRYIRDRVERMVRNERIDPESTYTQQLRSLRSVLLHHWDHNTVYRERLIGHGLAREDLDALDDPAVLPILTREDFLDGSIFCHTVLAEDTPVIEAESSGSTGRALTVLLTAASYKAMSLMAFREQLWHDLDIGSRYAEVRYFADGDPVPMAGVVSEHWGHQGMMAARTGSHLRLPIAQTVADQLRCLKDFEPGIIRTYPSNLLAMTQHLEHVGEHIPSVHTLRTLGEQLMAQDRARIERFWGAPIIDLYGSREVGPIGVACPDSGLFHVCVETVLVEILDQAGAPCAEGEVGQVVVSSLQNRATPLFRYEVGDRAAWGPRCPCGRTLPTIERVEGRVMHMLEMPGGDRIQFLPSSLDLPELAALGLLQVEQTAIGALEIRHLRSIDADDAIYAAVRDRLSDYYGHPLEVRFVPMDELPRGAADKVPWFIPMQVGP